MKTKLSMLGIAASALLLAGPLVAAQNSWPSETLSGKIVMVVPNQKLVVVKTHDGIPFDIDVTSHTRIKSGDRSMALKDLTQDLNKQVSVTFVPERHGDIARSIQVGG
jgi:hypothetical protein